MCARKGARAEQREDETAGARPVGHLEDRAGVLRRLPQEGLHLPVVPTARVEAGTHAHEPVLCHNTTS